ncbi:MAG: tRNA (adenosine(37)-N6)-dimethylallyltransferase MiaA [Bacillota bacterium]
MSSKPPIVSIVGPTGVGKTGLSLRLAREFCGEIVSADSMAVYRGMDIGTDKPTPEKRREIPHHLIDIVDPDEEFSAGEFKALAKRALEDIWSREKLPFLVGGTALYVRTLLYDYPLASVGADERMRRRLYEKETSGERGTLHRMLREIDPESANRLHPNDLRRIVRAIEVYHLTGTTMTTWRERTPKEPVYPVLLLGLWLPREELYRRIEERVDEMFREGLVEEVRGILRRFPNLGPTASQALGYREVAAYLDGELSMEECVELTKKNTRHFAKRQLMWFRKEPKISWIRADRETSKARNLVGKWLKGRGEERDV